jgi:hypothetical protein
MLARSFRSAGSGRFNDTFNRAYTDILENDDEKATPYPAASVPMERDGCPLSQFGIASADCFLSKDEATQGSLWRGQGIEYDEAWRSLLGDWPVPENRSRMDAYSRELFS